MKSPLPALPAGVPAQRFGKTPPSDEVVELGLLLPAQRAQALLDLSRRRNQSVAQLLRSLIDQAIRES